MLVFLYICITCIFIVLPNYCFQQIYPLNTIFFLIYSSPNNYIVTNTSLGKILWSSERWEVQFLCLEYQTIFFKIPSVHSNGLWHHRTSNLAVGYLPVSYSDHHPPNSFGRMWIPTYYYVFIYGSQDHDIIINLRMPTLFSHCFYWDFLYCFAGSLPEKEIQSLRPLVQARMARLILHAG